MNRQRLAEITALIDHRHNGPCDTHDGQEYLTAALPALIEEAGGLAATNCEARVVTWSSISLPLMKRAEVRACLAEARERNARRKLHWSAGRLGDLLRLSIAERETLDIRTIWPAEVTKAEFQAYTRARDAARKKAHRTAAGARPQEHSAERERPWTALGMSRRTYYRKQAAGTLPTAAQASGTVSSAIGRNYLQSGTDQCHEGRQTVPGPARKDSPSPIVGADGHAAGARTRAVRRGRAVASPLPGGEALSGGDLFGNRPIGSVVVETTASLRDYAGGPMRPDQRQAARDWLRQMGWSHGEFASLIGLSRQQVTNSLRPRGSDGFGREAAANMRRLLEVAA